MRRSEPERGDAPEKEGEGEGAGRPACEWGEFKRRVEKVRKGKKIGTSGNKVGARVKARSGADSEG